MHLDVVDAPAALHRRRRLVAQDLFDGVGDQAGVGHELGPLVRVLVEFQRSPAEHAGHRLGAGAADEGGEVDRLLHRQPAELAVVFGDLHVDEVGEHVVARVRLAIGQRLAEVLHEAEHGRHR